MQFPSIRRIVLGLITAVLLPITAIAAEPDPKNWPQTVAAAKGQTVYWNAWGGEQTINDYIAWTAAEVKTRFGITLEHVKLSDTAEAVSKVVAEKAAGRSEGGTVDLIWINGPNFLKMKENGLLFGPWADDLPGFKNIDAVGSPTLVTDFTVPTAGLEMPWARAQITFEYDGARVGQPPKSAKALLAWAKANPGRFTFPDPSNFLGATFLKQVLTELAPDAARLQQPVTDADFDAVTTPLWAYVTELTPALWRQGRAYPPNAAKLRQLLADNEIDIAFSFNPAGASSAIAQKILPATTRTFVFEGGTVGNTSFIAIPFNAAHKAAAMVVADFLLSPEAQLKKQDPKGMAGTTVLSLARLSAEDRARFANLERGVATLSPDELGKPLPEPHPSWMTRITAEWKKRYGVAL